MNINLNRPICFFDLETTGVNVVKDRIVEISIIKINIDNTEESKTWLINPEMPIPKIVSAIHGIDDEMVKSTKIRLMHSAYVRLLSTKIGITKKVVTLGKGG